MFRYVAVVLLDCRPVNDVFFAAWVAKSLNRESLLLAAGFRATDTHHVFVHGLVQPLAAWQTIALFSGMVVTFTPAGVHSPATYDFPTMLLQQVDWSAHAEVPGAAHAPGVYFHVLTDAGAQMFAVGQWCRQQFREDLAAQLQTDDSALTIKPTAPRVVDHFDKGYISSGVVVATEQLSRLPFPPARRQEDRIIVVLDCRRVLQGFLWILHRGPRLSLAEIAHRFEGRCPAGHSVTCTGAVVEDMPDGSYIQVRSGQLLVVEYVEDQLMQADSSQGGGGGSPPQIARDGATPLTRAVAVPLVRIAAVGP